MVVMTIYLGADIPVVLGVYGGWEAEDYRLCSFDVFASRDGSWPDLCCALTHADF